MYTSNMCVFTVLCDFSLHECNGVLFTMRKNLFAYLFILSIVSYTTVYYICSHRSQQQFIINSYNEEKLTELEQKIEFERKAIHALLVRLNTSMQMKKNDKRLFNKIGNESEVILEADQLYERRREELLRHPPEAIAVLVMACDRVTVTRCLDQLLKYQPDSTYFPIIVSQDCDHKPTAKAIRSYGDRLYHIQQPDQSDIQVSSEEIMFQGYFKIARHYGWALNQMFNIFNFNTTIIIEDDLDVSPDIFEYFLGTLPLLHADPTLWCVSAWNDNGKLALVNTAEKDVIYRTDFFPGLGWMLNKQVWAEISVKWPTSFWDDWLRQPQQRKNRACLRPELSRTRTFGKTGVSNGLFYENHLKFIYLNDQFVPFTQKNLTFLLKGYYDKQFLQAVYKSRIVTYRDLKLGYIFDGPVCIQYYTKDQFNRIAKAFGLMDDYRGGVPRTAYRGIVTFYYKKLRVYIAPHANWKGYDLTWS
ncbi:alpha-1,3-mannosyl-glycoprotein 2-beta-N-acetylglucosaminyltransferase-like [Macrosteles quadrilineatus]|uniref:alpha-1,3-mannosyl-glycoprotein 2-beta-N-acetylglucosaminyltransferase-like n=1 Tax=Macrosteles quadrilineatus TaxID=74068 RepID=UPI0023E1CDAE|nr:alpha-1,3-mannosyl-glycoprotein 2-beta-N-acetylglucosaminyltransferase-like [Macrosteles quadrilineatus]